MSLMEKVLINGEISNFILVVNDADCNSATLSSENLQSATSALAQMVKSDDREVLTKGRNLLSILDSIRMLLMFGTDCDY
jgi:hypothetical protein